MLPVLAKPGSSLQIKKSKEPYFPTTGMPSRLDTYGKSLQYETRYYFSKLMAGGEE